jgi:hypothetical protein
LARVLGQKLLGRRLEAVGRWECGNARPEPGFAYDFRLLVRVRSDEPWLFGLFSHGGTEAFWISEDGQVSEATADDILDFCG